MAKKKKRKFSVPILPGNNPSPGVYLDAPPIHGVDLPSYNVPEPYKVAPSRIIAPPANGHVGVDKIDTRPYVGSPAGKTRANTKPTNTSRSVRSKPFKASNAAVSAAGGGHSGHGRRAGRSATTRPRSNAPAKNWDPLGAAVRAAIAQETEPLQGAITHNKALTAAMTGELENIRGQSEAELKRMQANAAAAQAQVDTNLKNLYGDALTGDAAQRAGALAAAQGRGETAAQEINTGFYNRAKEAQSLASGEFERANRASIAQAQSRYPLIRRQFQLEDLKNEFLAKELGMKQGAQKFSEWLNTQQNDRANAGQLLDQQKFNAATQAANQAKRAEWRKIVDQVLYGTPTKTPVQVDGKTVYQTIPQGQAGSYAEAQKMLEGKVPRAYANPFLRDHYITPQKKAKKIQRDTVKGVKKTLGKFAS